MLKAILLETLSSSDQPAWSRSRSRDVSIVYCARMKDSLESASSSTGATRQDVLGAPQVHRLGRGSPHQAAAARLVAAEPRRVGSCPCSSSLEPSRELRLSRQSLASVKEQLGDADWQYVREEWSISSQGLLAVFVHMSVSQKLQKHRDGCRAVLKMIFQMFSSTKAAILN